MRRFAWALTALLIAGCGHHIGDSCNLNVDCDPTGLRFCDTSSVGGYCTIDGCDVGTCPSEAVCVRFFTQIPNEPCFSTLPFPDNGCRVDERCVCDQSVMGVCNPGPVGDNGQPGPDGHCAPESSERRWCMLGCGKDGDCRTGYMCRQTGTLGSEPVPSIDMGAGTPASFCAPLAM
jgi:hypothetical protein